MGFLIDRPSRPHERAGVRNGIQHREPAPVGVDDYRLLEIGRRWWIDGDEGHRGQIDGVNSGTRVASSGWQRRCRGIACGLFDLCGKAIWDTELVSDRRETFGQPAVVINAAQRTFHER